MSSAAGVVASVVYQFCTNAAFLLLCALGLILILGMMNIINLAHGELMMMGAYTASASYSRGAPFWLAAIITFVAVGVFGAGARSHDRPAFLRQGTRDDGRHLGREFCPVARIPAAVWPLHAADPDPRGNIALGQYSSSYYWISMFLIAGLLVVGLWWIYNRTDIGLQARATMQNPAMAQALGVDTRRIY